MMKLDRIRIIAALLAAVASVPSFSAVTLYVSPSGNDGGDGSIRRPFRTLVRARNAVRDAKAKGGVREVVFQPGTYVFSETLELSEEDSGLPGTPVVWCAKVPGSVCFDGGHRVKRWRKLTLDDVFAKGQLTPDVFAKVLVTDVTDAGTDALHPQGRFGGAVENGAETVMDLYFDGEALTLAREPNDEFLMTGEVRDKTSFRSTLSEPERWMREPELMACGYWHWMFLEETARVASIGADGWIMMNAEIFDNPYYKTIVASRPYFLVNALCAVDRPGEWFLDRKSGKLYVFPQSSAGEYVLSALARPFVVISNAHDIVFKGIDFCYGQTHGLVARNVANLRIADCRFMHLGGRALLLDPVKKAMISSCQMNDLGHGGVRLVAGNRKTLESGGSRITDCEISIPNRHRRTYAPCVDLDGVGTTVEHCHLHDCLSSAIRMDGNDMTVAYNLIERAVLESDDQGALDTYGYVSFQGNRIIGNVWRDIGHVNFTNRVSGGQAAVRLDDNICSVLITSNRFERVHSGTFGAINVNRGCRNIFENNLFVECDNECQAAIWMGLCSQGDWDNWIFKRGYEKSKWGEDMTSEVYRMRYPGIENYAKWPTEEPRNFIRRNIVVGEGNVAKGCFWRQPEQILDSQTGTNVVVATSGEIAAVAKRIGFGPLPKPSEVGPRSSSRVQGTTRKGKESK